MPFNHAVIRIIYIDTFHLIILCYTFCIYVYSFLIIFFSHLSTRVMLGSLIKLGNVASNSIFWTTAYRSSNLFLSFFYCDSSRVLSIFSTTLPYNSAIPISHPWSYPPLALCMCPLTCSLTTFPLFSTPDYSFPPPLWLLSVCS